MLEIPAIIIGGGGHAKVLIHALQLRQIPILGIVDEDNTKIGTTVMGVRVLGDDSFVKDYASEKICLVNGLGSIGSVCLRKKVYLRFKEQGYTFRSVIHPAAVVAADVILAEGVQIMAGAVIQPGCTIGCNAIINTRASIDHDCRIGDHAHIAPGCVLSGGVSIGAETHLGTGSVVIQGKTIGSGALVGAGAVVVGDVAAGKMVCGVPAKSVER